VPQPLIPLADSDTVQRPIALEGANDVPALSSNELDQLGSSTVEPSHRLLSQVEPLFESIAVGPNLDAQRDVHSPFAVSGLSLSRRRVVEDPVNASRAQVSLRVAESSMLAQTMGSAPSSSARCSMSAIAKGPSRW
jgi:hypothetical protein